MEKNYTFYIQGMRCKACELLTKSELEDAPNISCATSNLHARTVDIMGDFGEKTPENIAEELTTLLSPHGYALSTQPRNEPVRWSEFLVAIPIALAFVALFILLQKLGIVNIVHASNVNYGTAFLIGVIASLSTCMALVGGLLLSMSATFAKEGDTVKPQMLFHAGRLVSFFVFGGVIGALGSVFQLGTAGTFVLGLMIGFVMLVLGVNLLDIFHVTKKFQFAMPKSISEKALHMTNINHTLTPALIGIATFFLPCGFTQAMQIYTLSTGNFLRGSFTMFAFALGTLPVLALLSFSSFSIKDSSKSGVFFKAAGLIVILFAIFNVINSLVAVGWIQPVFNF